MKTISIAFGVLLMIQLVEMHFISELSANSTELGHVKAELHHQTVIFNKRFDDIERRIEVDWRLEEIAYTNNLNHLKAIWATIQTNR